MSQQQSPHKVPPSELQVSVRGTAATAVGGTDTVVVLWPSVSDPAGVFTESSVAATGTVLTVVRPGIYRIDFFAALAAAGDLNIALSLNAAAAGALTTTPTDFLVVDAGAGTEGVIALQGEVSNGAGDGPVLCHAGRTIRLVVGDTLRCLVTAGVTLDANNTRLFIDQIGQ